MVQQQHVVPSFPLLIARPQKVQTFQVFGGSDRVFKLSSFEGDDTMNLQSKGPNAFDSEFASGLGREASSRVGDFRTGKQHPQPLPSLLGTRFLPT